MLRVRQAIQHLQASGISLTACSLVLFLILTSALFSATQGVSIHLDVIGLALALALAGLGLAALTYTFLRPDRYLASASLGTFLLVVGIIAGGIISYFGTAALIPLVDADLVTFGKKLGFDDRALLYPLTANPLLLQVLAICYGISNALLFFTPLILVLFKRWEKSREFLFLFSVTFTCCVFTPFIFPAMGSYEFFRIAPASVGLPPGAGNYHVEAFTMLRNGPFESISIEALKGVVTFPSFHTCMALLIIFAFRDVQWLRWPMLMLGLITIIATIPMGGHYVADLFVAGVLFWTVFCAYKCLEARKNLNAPV
ncbi:MAG: phosphatase PAP2 family protein [Pseudomonadota bacterium]